MNKPTSILLITAFLSVCPGCATVVGTVVGPVTGPMTAYKHTAGMPAWAMPIALPAAIVIGPFLGMLQGIGCDIGFLRNGEYGAHGHPPFRLVFDPANVDLGARSTGVGTTIEDPRP